MKILHCVEAVIVTTLVSDYHYIYFITTLHPKFKVVMLTTVVVSITKFNNHYHVVISKLVSITVCCSNVHYTVFTVSHPFKIQPM